jgi:hypothetical protein
VALAGRLDINSNRILAARDCGKLA